MNITNQATRVVPASRADVGVPATLRRPFLLTCLLLATFLPLCGSLLRWKGLPPGYGAFPPQRVMAPPGFNTWYFAGMCAVVLVMALFLLVPRVYGFKAQKVAATPTTGELPYWFLPALSVMAISWGFMWFGTGLLARFSFVPLWWGFIYALDGLVYARTNGRSIVSARKHEMLVLALVSVVGWYLFEYLNYFVAANWYYPYANLLTPFGNLVWYTLSYTTVWPVCFEWYMLLMTFPAIRLRWANGPKLNPSRATMTGILVGGLALTFLLGLFPYLLFWGLWVGTLLVLGSALMVAGYWTPFAPLAKGDWSRIGVMALATLLNGFVWEFWNYGSQVFRSGVPSNPNYWVYDVPYVNTLHFFSEMPFLGYFGYLVFGVLVWVFWLAVAHLLELDPDFAHHDVMLAEAAKADELAARAAATVG